MSYTKGPWAAQGCRSGWYITSLTEPCVVVDTTDIEGRYGAIESEANARLIASAPDMLEALQRAREVLADFLKFTGGCDHDVGMCQCIEEGVLEKIDAAIKKATQS